jgi:hypothetical protein
VISDIVCFGILFRAFMSPSAQEARKEGEALSAAAAARKAGICIPYINICIYVNYLTKTHIFGFSYFH